MKKILLFLFFVLLGSRTFAQAGITLNSPLGGETWASGSTQFVIYTTSDVSQIRIRFTSNYGSTWSTLATQNTNNGPGFYSWVIPEVNALNSCQIKVMNTSDTLMAAISGYFSISGPSITALVPIGGETYDVGSTQTTYWSSSGVSASEAVKVEFSSNGGSSWQTVVNSTPNDDSCSWIVPNSPSNNCYLRISKLNNPSISSLSNIFNVTAPVSILLESPNGGQNFPVNTYQYINWAYNPSTTSYINLEYSTDGGVSYTYIASGIANSQSYQWYVPNTPSTNCKVRVSDYYFPNINDVSDANFTISGSLPTCIFDYSPLSGTTIANTSPTLYWYPQGTGGTSYDLYFGTNPNPPFVFNTAGTAYATGQLQNNTTYYWKVIPVNSSGSAPACSTWTFNTGNGSGNVYYMSDTSTVTTCTGNFYDSGGPAGNYQNGESYTKRFYPATAGQAINLYFNYFASESGYDYLRIYDGTSTNAPLLATQNGSSFTQSVTATNPLGALTVNFYSDGSQINTGWDATISCTNIGESVNLTSPNGGEYFCPGQQRTISWQASSLVSNVKLEYSIDGGVNYTTIINSTSAAQGSYLWTVPAAINSYYCYIRVSNVLNATTSDISNSAFYIIPGDLTVTYPNGSEIFNIGQGYYIYWNATTCTQTVNLQYSTNNGSTWTNIVTEVSNSGNYYWTIPNTPSASCLFKVVDSNNSNLFDQSNATFTIGAATPTVLVYYPNGGEVFNVGSGNYITWTASNVDYVSIFYSLNNGSTYTEIASNILASTGYYFWTTPNTPSTQCRVKVQQTSNGSITDVSDNVFTIATVEPTVLVTYPNGGENFTAGSSYYIYWNSTAIDLVNIDYSTNNGSTWTNIANNITSSLGYYYWLVPNVASTQCLIRVRNAASGNLPSDVSNYTFTISAVTPSIVVYYPNGGEQYYVGNSYQVSWYSYAITNVKLEFSTNNGSTYTTLVASYPTNGYTTYAWTIPNAISSECRFRVSDVSNVQTNDVSDNVFTILVGTPTVTVNSPNGGEVFTVGTNQYVSWTSSFIENVKLEYSTDGASSWTTIAASVPASSNYYYWGVPNVISSNCYVRVSSTINSGIRDQNNFAFSIVQPSVTLIYPNGGEVFTGGTSSTINWNASNLSNYVNLEYSLNGGQSWNYIDYSYFSGNSGTYNWTIPNVSSTACKIKVSDYYNSNINDISNSNFTINPATPTITVTSPNGGETYATNTNTSIYWQSLSVDAVKIEYTLNNGATWNLITANTQASLGYYYWNIPSTASSNCRVKVSSTANNSISDVSNSTFSIVVPTITVSYPNGGETFQGLTSSYISWSYSNVSSSYVNIQYSINNGASWSYIANGIYNNGYYNWNVPNTPSTQCLVKVSDYYNNTVVDESNSNFTIVGAQESILVNYPNGGEVFGTSTSQYISWSSASISNIKIEFSSDNGLNYTTVVASTPAANGYYYWTTPNSPSELCKVRISNTDNANVNDVSNNTFTISQPTINIITPSGGEIYQALTSQVINWSSTGVSNYVSLEYSIDSTNTWNTITSATYNNGYYNWYIPNTPSTKCFVRVRDYYNNIISDISNSKFTITAAPSTISLTYPNGFENFAVGSSYYIQWNSQSVQNVNISYSINGGQNYTTIANNINASIGNYLWTVADTPSENCLVKITDSNNELLSDVSNNLFTITTPFINLSTPNGGETYSVGSSYYIQWTSSGISNVKLEYSTDSGVNYNTILNSTTNYGYYYWNVPNIPSSQCKVRVSKAENANLNDSSNDNFTISVPNPTLVLTYPSGGESFVAGNNAYINWYSSGIQNVKIQYSINNGLSWNLLAATYPASNGYYYWNIPNSPTNSARVRVSNLNDSTLVSTSGVFSIQAATPAISINYPNGGETLSVGAFAYINWNYSNVSCFNLSYSIDNGITFITIAENLSSNYYYWNVPASVSNNCIIQVQDCYSSTSDFSNGVFSIINPVINNNTISLITISDSTLCRNDSIIVQYSATGVYNQGNVFGLQISDENGNFANPVLLGYLTTTSLQESITGVIPSWLVNGTNYRIRIVSSDLFAISNLSTATIHVGGPVVDFTVVNGQDVYYLPQQSSISFEATGDLQNVTSYLWNFGDGATSNSANPTHNYNDIVYFTVSLLVSDSAGCSTTVNKPNYIHTEFYFNNEDILGTDSLNITGASFLTQNTGCFTLANGNCIVTNNAGFNWTYSITGLPSTTSLTGATLINGNWFITGTNGTICISTNGGLTWIPFITGTNETFSSSSFINENFGVAVGTNGTVCIYNGTGWTPNILPGTSAVNFNGVAAFGDNLSIAVGSNGTVCRYSAGTWTAINTGFTENFTSVSFADAFIGYIVSENGRILRTSDGGLTWNVTLSGIDGQFSSVAAGSDQRVFAVGNLGLIYVSEDNGNSFARFSVGSTNSLNAVSVKSPRGYVTGSGGLGRAFGAAADTSTTSIYEKAINSLNNFEMYPNPAKENLTLKTYANAGTYLKVTIKDISGKTIEIVCNEILSGQVQKEILLNGYSSGTYFVHVQQGEFQFVKKLIIQH